jgi:hypothetical protein
MSGANMRRSYKEPTAAMMLMVRANELMRFEHKLWREESEFLGELIGHLPIMAKSQHCGQSE